MDILTTTSEKTKFGRTCLNKRPTPVHGWWLINDSVTPLPDDVISIYRKDIEQWLRPIEAITITGTNKSDVAQARISVTFTGE